MKKLLCVMICASMLICMLSSCANRPSGEDYKCIWRRGMNMGNMLEIVKEDTPAQINTDYFATIASLGFDFVRIPIKWSAYIDSDGVIDDEFMKTVVDAVDVAVKSKLGVMINIHHFTEICSEPSEYEQIFYKIWEQISEKFADYTDNVAFELLNEPNDSLDSDTWNTYLNNAIEIVRKTNPTRTIVVGGTDWNSVYGLYSLRLPENDKHLAATIHYYSPMEFTHQGASWASQYENLHDVQFDGLANELFTVDCDFQRVKAWSEATGIPVILGEFGAYNPAPEDDRKTWTCAIRESAEKYGIAWCYWEFCAGFGIYDKDAGQVRESLYRALIPETENMNYNTASADRFEAKKESSDGLVSASLEYPKPKFDYVDMPRFGYSSLDSEDGTYFSFGNAVQDGYVLLTTDLSAASADTARISMKNIDGIEDVVLALSSSNNLIMSSFLCDITGDDLKFGNDFITVNDDGTVTVTVDLKAAVVELGDNISGDLTIMLKIESAAEYVGYYDGQGVLLVTSVEY